MYPTMRLRIVETVKLEPVDDGVTTRVIVSEFQQMFVAQDSDRWIAEAGDKKIMDRHGKLKNSEELLKEVAHEWRPLPILRL